MHQYPLADVISKINCQFLFHSNYFVSFLQIATQLAVLIGKIARLDCPHHWHDLIPTLIENIRTPDQLQQHRTLLTLYHVVKTLSSKRLVSDRKVFQQVY